MDNILSYVITAAVMVLIAFLKARTDKKENDGQKKAAPATGRRHATHTAPARQGTPRPADTAPHGTASTADSPFIPSVPEEGGTPQPAVRQPVQTPPAEQRQDEEEVSSEYAFHSTEDVRKAIVWSEILRRKY